MFYLIALLVAASRFLPHPPNVACVGALGLFAGCYVTSYRAYLLPIGALLLSDTVGQIFGLPGMGFYNPVAMASVYAGMTASVCVGRWLAKNDSPLRIVGGSVAVSTVFFAVSNLGVWLAGSYPATPAGLFTCYFNALPFYGYTLAGDMAFSAVLFGAWQASGYSVRTVSSPELAR